MKNLMFVFALALFSFASVQVSAQEAAGSAVTPAAEVDKAKCAKDCKKACCMKAEAGKDGAAKATKCKKGCTKACCTKKGEAKADGTMGAKKACCAKGEKKACCAKKGKGKAEMAPKSEM